MIVTCPSCETKYRVDGEALMARGGKVRCNSCAHVWVVEDEALVLGDPAPEPVRNPAGASAEPGPQAAVAAEASRTFAAGEGNKPHKRIRERAEQRRRKARLAAEGAAWAGIAAMLGVAMLGAWLFRGDIVTAFPASNAAYAMAGVDVNPYGLEVRGLSAAHGEGDEQGALVIEGVVQNVTGAERRALPLKAALLDADGAPLIEWVIVLESHDIEPGGAERFRTVLEDAPEAAAQIDVVFSAES